MRKAISICLLAFTVAALPLVSAYPGPVPLSQASPMQRATDAFMGDWQGPASRIVSCAQVIALGKDAYRANLIPGFDHRVAALAVLEGKRAGDEVTFTGKGGRAPMAGAPITGSIKGGVFTGKVGGPKPVSFELKRITRPSQSLGVKAPKDAVALFDGKDLDAWRAADKDAACPWLLLDNGAMEVRGGGIISKEKFKDQRVHIEFRLPFMPDARGQARGNSGVYLQGRYEVQILDSYGLEGTDDECGAIYKVAAPRVNMCAPPLEWQTYDIVFRAAKFDPTGKKTKEASISVIQNGVVIIVNQSVPGPTTAAPNKENPEPAGLYLQDHGTPVWFRNIWVQPMEEVKK